ncbi:hypothetical protein NBO_58g0015 [Nosema bombycis CQ1]|uniref:Uncharacterized protein n=1 Tax=Nosema bombycis (strain CQ1 / CVCC 102059) TaxID=578461 RepID=R0KSS3_NOSB1|nr:hypothetical protein NBO_58g0015 [Nosema bombycis CQ1]|eukprot:EOB13811.1 hypothetical protein NBO_58g0015 [Nosema bombycis CQ1]
MNIREIIIKKIKDLQKIAIKSNLRTKFIYNKILSAIEKDTTPILTLNHIKSIPNIGLKTYTLLVEHINKELEHSITTLEELESYNLILNKETYDRIKNMFNTPIKRIQIVESAKSKPVQYQDYTR